METSLKADRKYRFRQVRSMARDELLRVVEALVHQTQPRSFG